MKRSIFSIMVFQGLMMFQFLMIPTVECRNAESESACVTQLRQTEMMRMGWWAWFFSNWNAEVPSARTEVTSMGAEG